jgi:WD40 repeat protein
VSDQPGGAPPNPYVGPQPFREGQTLYGRDREAVELRNLLIADRIVVLYSPAGAGKTSLIEAKLKAELLAADFNVLPVIRVNKTPAEGHGKSTNRYVLSALLSLDEGLASNAKRVPDEVVAPTLPDYLARQSQREKPPRSDLLIFDQFEEILTLDPTDVPAKEEFFSQVGKALENKRRWALFSIREEHLAALEPYTAGFPTRLTASFRLELLGSRAALQTMQGPATALGVEFTIEAANQVFDDLSQVRVQQPDGSAALKPGTTIEPVLLQVVCQRLWENMTKSGSRRIDVPLVTSLGDVNLALQHLYAESVKTVADQTGVPERKIRGWFDEHLITAYGMRGQVQREPEQSGGLEDAAIVQLLDRHLLRQETRRGVQWLELIHDRLIDPVREDNAAWFQTNLSALQKAATLWDNEKRVPGYLLTGEALANAKAWAETHRESLTDVDRAFLDESKGQQIQQESKRNREKASEERRLRKAAEAREHAEEALRLEAEGRATDQAVAAKELRRRYLIAVGLGAVALVAAFFAAWGWKSEGEQRANAEAAATEIAELAKTSESKLLAKNAEDEGQLASGLVISGNALSAADTVEARHVLLDKLKDSPIAKLDGGEGQVRGVAFSPNGDALVSAEETGSLRLWTAGDERSPTNGDALAAADVGDAIQRWSTATTRSPDVEVDVTGSLSGVAFAPDGRFIATGGSVGVQFWDWDPDTLSARGKPVFKSVTSIAYAPDSREVVAAGAGNRVVLVATGTHALTFLPRPTEEKDSSINAVAYASTGWIAAGRDDGTLLLWHRDEQKTPVVLTPPSWKDSTPGAKPVALTALAFDPTGQMLAAGDKSGTIWVWDIQTRQLRGYFTVDREVTSLAFTPLATSPGYIAAADQSGSVRRWFAKNLDPVGIRPLPIPPSGGTWSLAYSPDGYILATGSGDGPIYLWSTGGAPLVTSEPQSLGLDAVAAVAFSPQIDQLAAVSDTGTLRLCSPAVDSSANDVLAQDRLVCQTHPEGGGSLQTLAFSHRGDRLALGKGDGQVTILNLTNDAASVQLAAGASVESLVFSGDDSLLAAGLGAAPATDGSTGAIVLWDLATKREVARQERDSPATALATAAIGSALASYDETGATIWTIANGTLADPRALPTPVPTPTPVLSITLTPPPTPAALATPAPLPMLGHVRTLAFDPAGTSLAAVGTRGGLVWDVTTGEILLENQALMFGARSLAFSPDGKELAIGNDADSISMWSYIDGNWRYVGELGKPQSFIDEILQSPVVGLNWTDPQRLLAVGQDGSVWDLVVDPELWKAKACGIANQEATKRERESESWIAFPTVCAGS